MIVNTQLMTYFGIVTNSPLLIVLLRKHSTKHWPSGLGMKFAKILWKKFKYFSKRGMEMKLALTKLKKEEDTKNLSITITHVEIEYRNPLTKDKTRQWEPTMLCSSILK